MKEARRVTGPTGPAARPRIDRPRARAIRELNLEGTTLRLGTLAIETGTTAAVFVGDECAPVPGFTDAGAILRGGPEALAEAETAGAGPLEPYSEIALRAPVLAPGAVVCQGLNFKKHVLEMGREIPTAPTLFGKFPRALCGPSDVVPLTPASAAVDYEGELVAVIGRRARNVERENALEYVGGYTLMNDVSMRDLQSRSLQWFAGKNLEASTPVGPWIVTADEVDPATLTLTTTVSGEVRQHAQLSDLIFDVATLVADISTLFTLEPGDLIATGTPGGVGSSFKPGRFLRDGDVVTVTIDGIGALRTEFRA
jgi:acylpyruvate hydrolase